MGRSKNIRSQKIIQKPSKVVPTYEASKILQKRNVPLKSLSIFPGSSNNYDIEEWTEKLLEEARDDLELIHKGVQTDLQSDFSFTDVREAIKTQENFTQTDNEGSFQFESLVKSLACNAV